MGNTGSLDICYFKHGGCQNASLKGLSFWGVSQELAISQTGYMTRRKSDTNKTKNFTAQIQICESVTNGRRN